MVERARVACPVYRSAVPVESRGTVVRGNSCARRGAGRPHADFRLGRSCAAVKARRHGRVVTGALGQRRAEGRTLDPVLEAAGRDRGRVWWAEGVGLCSS